MSFDFNIDTKGEIRVSVMKLGIIFNKKTINVLGRPEKINIGIDYENKILGIKSSNGDPYVKEFDFVTKENQDWIRVATVTIVREIEKITGLKFNNKGFPFKATFNKELKMLMVDLKGEKND